MSTHGPTKVLFEFMLAGNMSSALTTVTGKWIGLNSHILKSQNLIKGLGTMVAAAGIMKAGEALEKGAIALAKANAGANHPYFRMQMAGIPQQEAAMIRRAAQLDRTKGLTYGAKLQIGEELKSQFGSGMAATKEVTRVLGEVSKAAAAIRYFNPSLTEEDAAHQAFKIFKAREATGKMTDAKGHIMESAMMEQMRRGLGYYFASGGDDDGDSQLTRIKRMKSARGIFTNEGEDYEYAVARTLGSAAAGTMASTFASSFAGGHMTDQAKRSAMLDGFATSAGQPKGGNFGTHVGPVSANQDFVANPTGYLLGIHPKTGRSRLDAWLSRHGIAKPIEGDTEAARRDNERYKRAVSFAALSDGYNPNTAGKIAETIMNAGVLQREVHSAQIAARADAYGVAQGDPLTQAQNIKTGLDTFKQALFNSEAAVPIMKAWSGILNGMGQGAQKHSGASGGVGLGMLAVGEVAKVGGAAYLGYQGLKFGRKLLPLGGALLRGGAGVAAGAGALEAGAATAAGIGGAEALAGGLAAGAAGSAATGVGIPLAIGLGLTAAGIGAWAYFHHRKMKKQAAATQGVDTKQFGTWATEMSKGWEGVSLAFNTGANQFYNTATQTLRQASERAIAAVAVPIPAPANQNTAVTLNMDGRRVGHLLMNHAADAAGGSTARGNPRHNVRMSPPKKGG